MRALGITLRTLPIILLGLLLHYSLPQHDVVRVINTYQERQDLNDWTRVFWARPDDQSATLINRDVQFIQTAKKRTWLLGFWPREGTEVMVYRNEDTGFSWPFYFKFDTANLQTEADDIVSTAEEPQWAVMTHYGWRSQILSAFPNAVSIRPVDTPKPMIIPWFNIAFFVFLAFLIGMVRAMWRQFRERAIDPALDSAGDTYDQVQANVEESRAGWRRWINSFRSKDKR